MRKIRLLAVLNLLAFGIHLTISWLTQQKMINDSDVAEISNRYPTLFTPAGMTFAIWGLIYLLLLLFCIYHIFTSWYYPAEHQGNMDTGRIGGLFIFNSLATAAWLYYFTHAWLLASLLLIIIQLITLASIHLRLSIYDRDAGILSKIFTQLPLSIYLAWITVATIANASAFLAAIAWDGLGISEVKWTIIMIAAAVFIGGCMILGRRNIFFGLVIIWALIGIMLKHSAAGAPAYPTIILAAQAGIVITGIACLLQLARNIAFRKAYQRKHYPLFNESPHPTE